MRLPSLSSRRSLTGSAATRFAGGVRVYLRKYHEFYLMLVPVLAFYFIFKYLPMYGVVIAFQDYSIFRGVAGSAWIGFENFAWAFEQPTFWLAAANTIKLNLLSLFFGFPAPIILALLLNEVRRRSFKAVVQSISYLPHFFSWVVVYGIVLAFFSPFNGMLPKLLHNLGLESVQFLTRINWWLSIFVGSGIWKGAGWAAIIYISALSAIDPDLYDAAYVDGAGLLRSTWHVTLPGIRSTIIIIFIINLGQLLNIGFEQPFLLGNAHVSDVAEVLSTYIYRFGLLQQEFSLTAAVGLMQSLINFGLLILANYVIRLTGQRGIW